MFTTFANTAIDTIQSTKKIAVETFVKHDDLAKSLNSFVDSQTEYTKKAVENGFNTAKSVMSVFSDPKFIKDITASAQDQINFWLPKKGK